MIKICILLLLIIYTVKGDNSFQNYVRNINQNIASSSISGLPFKDNPSRFLGPRYITNINNLPYHGITKIKPFSSDYWAWRYGGPSARYNKMDTRWKPFPVSIRMYSQPSEHNTYKNDANYSDRVNSFYSPVEKYDLLVGDETFTLTRTVKNYGNRLGGGKDFATWMGLCHGFAPASYMFPEPVKYVELIASDKKTKIRFFVDDIKALGVLFWAFAKYPSRVVGRRTGPVHPASFFLILTNYIGLQKKNMNFEPFADNEIWNYPVSGYTYSLYNVNSGSSGSFSECSVSLAAARSASSTLARQAAANARSGASLIVGVKMTVNYVSENTARVSPEPRQDKSTSYNFILILRANGSIIDGYWTSARKPSFVWGPAKDVNGPYDRFVPRKFNGLASELNKFTHYAKLSSKIYMPLKAILNYLYESAK